MQLTNPEKLILNMLCDLIDHTKCPVSYDTDFIRNAISSDRTWAITLKLHEILGDDQGALPPDVIEVGKVLELYRDLNWSFGRLEEVGQARISKECGLINNRIGFPGFDEGYELGQIHIARQLIALDRTLWRKLQWPGSEDLISNCPMMPKYQKMLAAAQRIETSRAEDECFNLCPEEIAYISNA